MCRANIDPHAEQALTQLLDDIARCLAERDGVDRELVLIGPVDLGPPDDTARAAA